MGKVKVVQWSMFWKRMWDVDFHANVLIAYATVTSGAFCTCMALFFFFLFFFTSRGNTMSRLLADFATLGPKVNTVMGPLKGPSSPAVVFRPTCNVFPGWLLPPSLRFPVRARGATQPRAHPRIQVAYFGLNGWLPWLVLADKYWLTNEQTRKCNFKSL